MKTTKLSMPNGETIDAVLIKSFEEIVNDNEFLRDSQDLYYGQNRLFLRKYRYEIYPTFLEDEPWATKIYGEPNIEILCDYVFIPECDEALENRHNNE